MSVSVLVMRNDECWEMEADSGVRTMRAMQQMWSRSQSPGWQEMPQMIGATWSSDWLMAHIHVLWLVNTRVWMTRCYKWSETWVADGGLWLRDWGVTNTPASCCSESLIASPHMHREPNCSKLCCMEFCPHRFSCSFFWNQKFMLKMLRFFKGFPL